MPQSLPHRLGRKFGYGFGPPRQLTDWYSCLQVWIGGEAGATIRPVTTAQLVVVALSPGAPPVHVSNVRIVGHVSVSGGRLWLNDCSIDAVARPNDLEGARSPGRHLTSSAAARAFEITGGEVTLTRTSLRDHSMGAMGVQQGRLTLIECTAHGNRAPSGGAMLVGAGAIITVLRSTFSANTADTTGGALQVVTRSLECIHRRPVLACTHTRCARVTHRNRWTAVRFTCRIRRFLRTTRPRTVAAARSTSPRAEGCCTRFQHHRADGSTCEGVSRCSLMRVQRIWCFRTAAAPVLSGVPCLRTNRAQRVRGNGNDPMIHTVLP